MTLINQDNQNTFKIIPLPGKPMSDPTFGPLDIAPSYVESAYNQGTVDISNLIASSDLVGTSTPILSTPIFQPGAGGARTVPNQGGFAYSDTPETTVFIVKKQWAEQEWTYTSVAAERPGKKEELLTRISLANLLSRKLDLLNSHELFTKFSDLTQGMSKAFTDQLNNNSANVTLSGAQTTRYYTEYFALEPTTPPTIIPVQTTPAPTGIVPEVAAAVPEPPTPPSDQVITIATQVIVNTTGLGPSGRLIIRAAPSFDAQVLSALAGPNSVPGLTPAPVFTTGIGDPNMPDNVVNGQNSIDSNGHITLYYPTIIDENQDGSVTGDQALATKFGAPAGAQFWKIDLTQLTASQLYVKDGHPPQLTPAIHPGEFSGTPDQVLQQLQSVGVGYVARNAMGRQPPNNTAAVAQTTTVPVTTPTPPPAPAPTPPPVSPPAPPVTPAPAPLVSTGGPALTIQNLFNGVIELTNVSQVQTTITNKGTPGTAQLTLQNPNNCLAISEDDIDIALGTNPYLLGLGTDAFGQSLDDIVEIDPVTGTKMVFKYYRGRYYTERAYSIVTNQDLGVIGNFTTTNNIQSAQLLLNAVQQDLANVIAFANNGTFNQTIATSLRAGDNASYDSITDQTGKAIITVSISVDTSGITNAITSAISSASSSVQSALGGTSSPSTYPFYQQYSTQTQQLIQQLALAALTVKQQITNLQVQSTLPTDSDSTTSSPQANIDYRWRRAQMQKYYQNRTIFEVYDRVYIWMSSPSRTAHTLEDGTPVAEDLQQNAALIQRVQNIMSLINQLNGIVQSISIQLKNPITTVISSDESSVIAADLTNTSFTGTYPATWETVETRINGIFTAPPIPFSALFGGSPPPASPPPAVNILLQTINSRMEDLAVFKVSLQAADTLPSAANDTNVQGINPASLFSQTYVGLNDTQFQVFQGVITKISRSFSDSQFQIRIECEDNLNFLSRSRFVEIPGLNTQLVKVRPFLDDPIWRSKDAVFLSRIQDVAPDNLVGRWKTGVLTVTASIAQGKDAASQSAQNSQTTTPTTPSNVLTEDVVSRALGRPAYSQTENQAFEGADPAQIVSVLVTGIPFDLNLYITNSLLLGSVKDSNAVVAGGSDQHTGEDFYFGPFEQVRQGILQQDKKYGDFQPFLSQDVEVSDALTAQLNLAGAVTMCYAMMQFAKVYLQIRQALFAPAYTAIQTAQLQEESQWRVVDATTITNIINFNSSTFPDTLDDIELTGDFTSSSFQVISYIIQFALQNTDSNSLNNLFTNAFNASAFDNIVSGSSSAFSSFTNRDLLALTLDEVNLYANIINNANAYIANGQALTLLAMTNQDKTKPPINHQTATAQLQTAKMQYYNKLQPLQVQKSAIIYKQKTNFFVVSNQYLNAPNLTDYVRQIRDNAGSFADNSYSTVLDRCKVAANRIDYEFYADSQGHIRFKPPTYNRTYLRHLLDITNLDPTYVAQMQDFFEQYNLDDLVMSLAYQKYLSILLDAKTGMMSSVQNLLTQAMTTPLPVGLLSSGTAFGSSILGAIFGTPAPTTLLAQLLQDNIISQQLLTQIRAFLQAPATAVQIVDGDEELSSNVNFNPNDLKTQLGAGFTDSSNSLSDFLSSSDKSTDSATQAPAAVQQIYTAQNEIQTAIGTFNYDLDTFTILVQVQQALDALGGPLAQIGSAFTGSSDAIQSALTAAEQSFDVALQKCLSLSKALSDAIDATNSVIAGIQAELDPVIQALTDEQYIHTISSAIIISETYEESSPDFTRLNAHTSFPFTNSGQSTVPDDYIHWVGSVDYDLWRIYGYIPSDNVEIPFMQNAQQAAPYVHLLMARQYGKILKGSIVVRGDSKYQLGDCAYIEDENLYYYIVAISHSFTYGSTYTTTLTLEYGRRPTQYIPYPFDALGAQFTQGTNELYSIQESDLQTIINAQVAEDAANQVNT